MVALWLKMASSFHPTKNDPQPSKPIDGNLSAHIITSDREGVTK